MYTIQDGGWAHQGIPAKALPVRICRGCEMTDQEKILEKVRRLFELAKSSNEHESAAAAAKAQELLHKYNLSQHDIPTDEKEPFIEVKLRLKNRARWTGTLLNVLAKANGAYVVHTSDAYNEYAVLGQKHTIEIVEFSYSQMEKRITWLADVAWDIYLGDEDSAVMYKDGFARGIINRLNDRLHKQVEEQRVESKESTALVVQHDRELTEYVRQVYPRLTNRRVTFAASDGYGDGQRAGRFLNVHAGVTGGAKGMRRLE